MVLEGGGRTDDTVERRLGGAAVAVGVAGSAAVVAVGVEVVGGTVLLAVAVIGSEETNGGVTAGALIGVYWH